MVHFAASSTPIDRPRTAGNVDRIDTEDRLAGWLADAIGLHRVRTVTVPVRVLLDENLAWELVLGTGFRGMVAALDGPAVDGIRAGLLRRLTDRGVHHVDATALVGVGSVPTPKTPPPETQADHDRRWQHVHLRGRSG